MRLVDVSLQTPPGRVCLVGTIERGAARERSEIYFEYPERFRPFVSESADPFAAVMLLPAAHAEEPLEVVPPISARLHFNLPRVLDVWRTWYPKIADIRIETRPRSATPAPPTGRAATFFSGGVDSFYTLLKRRRDESALPAPLTHLVFMKGIETRLEWVKGIEESQRQVEDVAREAGVECVFGESNIRTFSRLHWENFYHGAGLAATALSLSRGFDYFCIPSTYSYNHMVRYGSSHLVDELFSTTSFQIVHDGSEVTRAGKVERIVHWDRDFVLRSLRVCSKNNGGGYNCGKCYKCVRTAVALSSSGAWSDAATFPDKGRDHWENILDKDHLAFTEENLDLARDRGADPEVTGMLERVVRRKRRKAALKTLAHSTPFERVLPLARRVRARLG